MVKPSKKKKPFISKKNATTFRLVHRSQKDPLVADEQAPQHVLLSASDNLKSDDNTKTEQKKFGVFFDDDYNYLAHLKDVNQVAELECMERVRINRTALPLHTPAVVNNELKLLLPSSVFASSVEEDVGLLNKAAPAHDQYMDMDIRDVVAALDEAPDSPSCEDEQFFEDLVALANAETGSAAEADDECSESEEDSDFANEDRDIADDISDAGNNDYESIVKNYMKRSSQPGTSAIQLNEGLVDLDERFENFLERHYGEEMIGDLDGEDIQGSVYPDAKDSIFASVLEEYEKKKNEFMDAREFFDKEKPKDAILSRLAALSDDEVEELVIESRSKEWDCESILSIYSNTRHHPRIIPIAEPIRVSATGIPRDTLPKRGLTQQMLTSLDDDEKSKGKRKSERPCRHETPEEKKSRKRLVKEEKKERRQEKKVNQLAFKEEKKRQQQVVLNIQRNLQGIKIA